MMKLLVRLYPASWRDRYEAEFAALLEDVQPSWRGSVDIFKGALIMQLSTLHFGKSLVLLGVLGFFTALIPSYFIQDQFASEAVLKIQPFSADASRVSRTALTERVTQWVVPMFSNQSLRRLIDKYKLYPDTEGKESKEATTARMREAIRTSPVGSDGVKLQFRYFDRFKAKRVADELTDDLADRSHKGGEGNRLFELAILHPAQTPSFPIYPPRLFIALGGLVTGVGIGLIRAFLRRSAKAGQEAA